MNYPPGPYVLLSEVETALKSYPLKYDELLNGMRNLPKYNPPDSQAEELLTAVCEYIIDVKEDWNTDPQGKALRFLSHIPGLAEWWANHKPKSEREKKLEKIACALSLDGKSNCDFLKVAERVLNALES